MIPTRQRRVTLLVAMGGLLSLTACSDKGGGGGEDCTPGTRDCECRADGTCDTYAGVPMTCIGGVCLEAVPCTPGTSGCVCDATGACEGGLECDDGYCATGARLGLDVSSAEARSCECVLADPDEALGTVLYASSVTGRDDRRGDRVAVAWFSNADAAFASGAVTLELASATASAANLTMVESTCYDRLGQELAGVEVTLGE